MCSFVLSVARSGIDQGRAGEAAGGSTLSGQEQIRLQTAVPSSGTLHLLALYATYLIRDAPLCPSPAVLAVLKGHTEIRVTVRLG